MFYFILNLRNSIHIQYNQMHNYSHLEIGSNRTVRRIVSVEISVVSRNYNSLSWDLVWVLQIVVWIDSEVHRILQELGVESRVKLVYTSWACQKIKPQPTTYFLQNKNQIRKTCFSKHNCLIILYSRINVNLNSSFKSDA